MDRAYKEDIPAYRRVLTELRREFRRIDLDTDWIGLRIDPLLRHARMLERALLSPKFSSEQSRLRNGVSMFHSDLVYLRENIKTLKAILAKSSRRRIRNEKGA